MVLIFLKRTMFLMFFGVKSIVSKEKGHKKSKVERNRSFLQK